MESFKASSEYKLQSHKLLKTKGFTCVSLTNFGKLAVAYDLLPLM